MGFLARLRLEDHNRRKVLGVRHSTLALSV